MSADSFTTEKYNEPSSMAVSAAIEKLRDFFWEHTNYTAEATAADILLAHIRQQAAEIKRLRDALGDIASGEVGINSCIRHAKKTLGVSL